MYELPDQSGRLVVVTGASSGTGREAARRLAIAGAEVVLAVRSGERGEATRQKIVEEHPPSKVRVRRVDLADLASVRDFADALTAEGRPVDTLINNAGVMSTGRRLETPDGWELNWATNFLGHFALTVRLLPLLLRAAAPRVVTVSSLAAAVGRFEVGVKRPRRHLLPYGAYARSKLAELLMAQHLSLVALAREWPLTSVAAHPGFTRTNLFLTTAPYEGGRSRRGWIARLAPLLAQDVTAGVEPILVAATADPLPGAYYGPGGPFSLAGPTTLVRLPRSARSPDVAARLWREGELLTGESIDNYDR